MTPAKKAKKRYYKKNRQACIDRAGAWNKKNRRKKYLKMKAWLDELRSNPCMDCNRTFPPVCMDFDHRPGEIKRACVAVLMRNGFSKETVMAEIVKCDLVCANCHRIRTQKRCEEAYDIYMKELK